MQTITSAINKYVNHDYTIFYFWQQLVELDKIFKQLLRTCINNTEFFCAVVYYDENSLTIAVQQSSWAVRLRYHQSQLLRQKLLIHPETNLPFTELKFIVNYHATDQDKYNNKKNKIIYAHSDLKKQHLTAIFNMINTIQDVAIREKLKKLLC